jgi:3-oxoacyl-(acyl-carrier-protein) synthase
MAINTPLGDTLKGFLDALLDGRSALSQWKAVDTSRIYCKVGADLSPYDIPAKVASFEGRVPDDVAKRLRRLTAKAPWSTRLTMLMALDGAVDAGLLDGGVDLENTAAIVGGHNLNLNYQYENRLQFEQEPDFIDSMLSLHGLDTDHVGRVSELLGVKGPIYTVGAACASANMALRCGVDEIRHHGADAVVVTGAVLDFSPIELHALALMGAISYTSFNEAPERASRPYDARREGFVPAHGGGTLVIESLESARRRGARIYAEVLGVEASADGNHLPQPSEDGQSRAMAKALRQSGVEPHQIDYINAHATSTPLGDLTELRSIKRVFGEQARRLKVNATKSMLGHTCWAAPIVETVAAVLQMNAATLHPSINIEELDPEVDLDVCAKGPVDCQVRYLMKNSFGFGGINCVSVLKRFEP